jgi:hypothetical protein
MTGRDAPRYSLHMLFAASFAIAIVGCHPRIKVEKTAPPPPPRYPEGTRSDFKTPFGPYEGYELGEQCEEKSCFYVHGTGSRWYPGMERHGSEMYFEPLRAGFEQFRKEVMRELDGLPVWGSGLGLRCKDFGMVLWFSDWRRLDEAVGRIGALLRREDLREPVTICIRANNFRLL